MRDRVCCWSSPRAALTPLPANTSGGGPSQVGLSSSYLPPPPTPGCAAAPLARHGGGSAGSTGPRQRQGEPGAWLQMLWQTNVCLGVVLTHCSAHAAAARRSPPRAHVSLRCPCCASNSGLTSEHPRPTPTPPAVQLGPLRVGAAPRAATPRRVGTSGGGGRGRVSAVDAWACPGMPRSSLRGGLALCMLPWLSAAVGGASAALAWRPWPGLEGHLLVNYW